MASNTTEFSARVPTDEYEKFKGNFPQYGAVTWFITTALSTFNAEVEKDPTSVERINKSIQAMMELPKEVERLQDAKRELASAND